MKIPLSVSIILSGYFVSFAASAQSSLPFNHPKDQIAIQLGAIQMGYTVPFQLVSGNSTNSQQAANALVMGRNALDATVAKPAAKVEGFKDSPSVDTIEYRDQLYQAVEAVVISPVIGQVKGSATLVGGKKQTATAKFTVPPNAYTIPVPFALEAATSVDARVLRDELVTLRAELVNAGVLNMIKVQGGTLPQGSKFAGQTLSTFEIGKYEVTLDEWREVRIWAVANGYSDLAEGAGNTGSHPVQEVSWYDVVKWCNAKSQRTGLAPVYQLIGAVYKSGESVPTMSSSANGYRLPSEKEWEWAARGGVSSRGYAYSGSNDVDTVAWYSSNSARSPQVVGKKWANELEIYDMSGNVWEWCEDVVAGSNRRIRGGACDTHADSCAVALSHPNLSYPPNYTDDYDLPHYRNPYIGFRLARSSGN